MNNNEREKQEQFNRRANRCGTELYGAIISSGDRYRNIEARLPEENKQYKSWDFLRTYNEHSDLCLSDKEYDVINKEFCILQKRDKNADLCKIRMLKWLFEIYEKQKITEYSLLKSCFIVSERQHTNIHQTSVLMVNEGYILSGLRPYYVLKEFYQLYQANIISEEMKDRAVESLYRMIKATSLVQEYSKYKINVKKIIEEQESLIQSIEFCTNYNSLGALDKIYNIIEEYCDKTYNCNIDIKGIGLQATREYIVIIKTVMELHRYGIVSVLDVYRFIYMLIRKIENKHVFTSTKLEIEDKLDGWENNNFKNLILRNYNKEITLQNINLRNGMGRSCAFVSDDTGTANDQFQVFIPKRFTTQRELYYTIYNSTYWALFYENERTELLNRIDSYLNNKWRGYKTKIDVRQFKKYITSNYYRFGIKTDELVRILYTITCLICTEKGTSSVTINSYDLEEKIGNLRKIPSNIKEKIFLPDKLSEKTPDELATYLYKELPSGLLKSETTEKDIQKYLDSNIYKSLHLDEINKRVLIWNNHVAKRKGEVEEESLKVKLGNVVGRINIDIAIKALKKCYSKNPYKIKLDIVELSLIDENQALWAIDEIEDSVKIINKDLEVDELQATNEILECLYYMGQKKCEIKELGENTIFTIEGESVFNEAIKKDRLKKEIEVSTILRKVKREIFQKYSFSLEQQQIVLDFIEKHWEVKDVFKEGVQILEERMCSILGNDYIIKNKIRQILQEYVCDENDYSIMETNFDISTLSNVLENYSDFDSLIKSKLLVEDIKKITYANIELDLYCHRYWEYRGIDSELFEKIKLYFHSEMTRELYDALKEEILRWFDAVEKNYKQGKEEDVAQCVFEIYKFEQVMKLIVVNNMFLEKTKNYYMDDKWISAGTLSSVCSRIGIYNHTKDEKVEFNLQLADNLNYYLRFRVTEHDHCPFNLYEMLVQTFSYLRTSYKWNLVDKKINESDENFDIYKECYNTIRNSMNI